MTFENSQQTFLDETVFPLTSYAEGSRARTSVSPDRATAWMASVRGYGRKSGVLLANYDQSSSSWKTFQRCLETGWESYSETWPRSGLMQSGTAYRLPELAPRTIAI